MTPLPELAATLSEAQRAIISDCGKYRYWLERQCEGEGATGIIMVNPSTADAANDDATIRKLRGFGDRHKWGRLIVGNLFAYRATDVRELSAVSDPIGPDNDYWLGRIAGTVNRVIYAWGPTAKQPRAYRGIRWPRVTGIFLGVDEFSIGEPAMCGAPKHPLMLPYSSPINPWSAPHA